MPNYDPATTALVFIDLQHGIVGMNLAPRSGEQVVATARDMAARFREQGAPVVFVHVGWDADGNDRPSQNVDKPMIKPGRDLPADWSTIVDGLVQPGDIVIYKHHWGAFTGTDLDLQLRRRGVTGIVLGGIATNMGVESTARSAWELSYDITIVSDACSAPTAEMHEFAVGTIFPMFSRLVLADDVTVSG